MREELNTILGCFGGADGAVSFSKLKCFLERLEDNDSPAALECKYVVAKMAKLIIAVNDGVDPGA